MCKTSFMKKMNRVEVKNKLKGLIRHMILSDSEIEIPDVVARQILQDHGCTVEENQSEEDGLDAFVKNLQKWIENNHPGHESSVKRAEGVDIDLNLYEEFVQAETEYCEVTSKLVKLLEEVLQHKETYSEYLKNECHAQDTEVEVLAKKCQFLKHQFFLKLYGEEDALKGHLALREKLREELDSLEKQHSELLQYNKDMSEIKNDKTFCELFKVYKELKQIEEMTEIIGTM